ncbi:hypothetical protein A3D00_01725 [Candidatus Woesebacteria bacterium RIFCSPHIGHO2_02_FULL_38_9]|uniref:Uncharacterized protein n=1 Tax=Candidatus Woesebacteria bacterium RIFCSPHIGHO2_01_FULL_39_28 TaxID=1802496 RepID=A0A1F7YFL1_9BACT|nr:MAG: hypothetical protein A2627_03725 [Candidatus Woesebacteria bacterium RIFCSPHIGHO2_01_FULL_39_28]OGM33647.1 MAG: hypothetical protein A3D00_01725 [Candidatus Woesebacteria bacterium RIFCSPHIGHO2_02_FULL_38_9]OGM58532.1 MAG: hypothetical protein A3A50_00735 [Candidatus Woesebacteria bacterium RIFCSPLOWO2_01_FULL_38_20]
MTLLEGRGDQLKLAVTGNRREHSNQLPAVDQGDVPVEPRQAQEVVVKLRQVSHPIDRMPDGSLVQIDVNISSRDFTIDFKHDPVPTA